MMRSLYKPKFLKFEDTQLAQASPGLLATLHSAKPPDQRPARPHTGAGSERWCYEKVTAYSQFTEGQTEAQRQGHIRTQAWGPLLGGFRDHMASEQWAWDSNQAQLAPLPQPGHHSTEPPGLITRSGWD